MGEHCDLCDADLMDRPGYKCCPDCATKHDRMAVENQAWRSERLAIIHHPWLLQPKAALYDELTGDAYENIDAAVDALMNESERLAIIHHPWLLQPRAALYMAEREE